MTDTITAYWFFGDTLRDSRHIPPDGEWLVEDGPIELCNKGLHWSRDPFDALKYAPGPNLALVEARGTVLEQADKGCSTYRRIIKRFDATELLRDQARKSALTVIHLWDAPKIVREYLETGDESKRAAAWAAARTAAVAAARQRFNDAVTEAFSKVTP